MAIDRVALTADLAGLIIAMVAALETAADDIPAYLRTGGPTSTVASGN